MKRLLMIIALLSFLAIPVNAMEFTAPEVPDSGREFLPDEPETFTQGLWQIIQEGIARFQPAVSECASMCLRVGAIVILVSLVGNISEASGSTVELIGTLAVAGILLQPSGVLINLGLKTVTDISEYGKLLLPILTGALAAQGGSGTSAALYAGVTAFDAVLSGLIANLVAPMVYIYLSLAVASCAIGDAALEKMKNFVKWAITWLLKTILYVFSAYMGITGVISGSADAAAVKAAKLTISGMVPVVGNILSDASETILVGAGVMKNAVGVYGLLAILATWIGPFIRIGVQYLLFKLTAAVCGLFSSKQTVKLINDVSGTMGLVLGMTGTVCVFLLISVVCFMKGVA